MKYNSDFNKMVAVSVLSIIFFWGCVAAIPIAVYYYNTDNNYVATAEVKKGADDLWPAVIQTVEKQRVEGKQKLKILKRDDTERLIEATDGKQTGSIKIIPDGNRKSKIIVTADVPKEEEKELDKEHELAAFIMKSLCEEAKVECKLVEE
jgi:hypothetical protein